MKIIILTTQTLHHTKFVQDILEVCPDIDVILETKSLIPPFDINHSYLELQDDYESNLWFQGTLPKIKDFVHSIEVNNINDQDCFSFIMNAEPDLIVVFGTSRIRASLINCLSRPALNLHGGDPEYYRGLDSHLWSIYHGEYNRLVTSLHEVSAALDAGAILNKRPVKLTPAMELFQLRAANTDCCCSLVIDAIKQYQKEGSWNAQAQKQIGRYYSFMPTVLKEVCVKKFKGYMTP